MMNTAVIGLGNPLIGDEGIGVVLIAKLQELYDCSGIDCRDIGTSVFSLIHVLEGKTKAVIVDCALMGKQPGTMERFTPEEVTSVKKFLHFSLHEGDLFGILQVAGSFWHHQPEIVFFGIEPASLVAGEELSTVLEEKIPMFLELLAKELEIVKNRKSGHA
jgi:hydrogenase maturation protease